MEPGLKATPVACGEPPVWAAATGVLPGIALAFERRAEPGIRFLLAWAASWWLVVELVPTKLPHYVIHAYPALAILLAAAQAGQHLDLVAAGRPEANLSQQRAAVGADHVDAGEFASAHHGARRNAHAVCLACRCGQPDAREHAGRGGSSDGQVEPQLHAVGGGVHRRQS